MRPDAYLIVADGRRLYAPTLKELAEVAACAIGEGDPIGLPRVQERGRWRPLRERDCERFVRSIADRLA